MSSAENSPTASPKQHVDPNASSPAAQASPTSPTAPDAAPTGPSWEELKEEGNHFFKQGNYVKAADVFSAAIRAAPTVATLYSNRCACHLKTKQFSEAYDDATKCVELDPNFLKGYGRLAHAAGALGRFDVRVADTLAQGVRLAKAAGHADISKELSTEVDKFNQSRKALEMVSEKMSQKLYDQALMFAASVCRNYPECLRAALLRAECRAVKQPEDALRELEMFQGDPRTHTSDYIFVRGLANYYNGPNGPKTAITLLKHVIECDPDHARAKQLYKQARLLEQHRTAGNTAYQEKRWREAVQAYTDALAVDPSLVKMQGILFGNRSAALLELGEYRKAKEDLDAAIAGHNQTAKIYARRSKVFEKLEQWDDAQSDLSKAAELDAEYRRELSQLKERVRLAKRKDWYKVLGVERNASDSDLKRAYKLSAVKWHPDKWCNASEEEQKVAEAKFKEVGEAFAILSDPNKKRMYDSGQIDNEADHSSGGRPGAGGGMHGGMHGGMADVDMMEMFNMMMGGGMGGMGMGGMGGMGGRGRGGRPRGGPSFHFGGM